MSTLKFLACFSIIVLFRTVDSSDVLVKCCPIGSTFDGDFRCAIATDYNSTISAASGIGNTSETESACLRHGEKAHSPYDENTKTNLTELDDCMEIDQHDGIIHVMKCPANWQNRTEHCDSVFTPLKFWGASIVVFANLIYLIPYLLVVVVYLALPELWNRAYDRAVFCYNGCQFITAIILGGMGFFLNCHQPIRPPWVLLILGLSLQFLTISSVLWLNMICLDMTLVITRCRWKHGSDVSGKEERNKFRKYSACCWGVGIIATAITCFLALLPYIPKTSMIKPDFERFSDGTNYTVVAYVLTIPILTLLSNNGLFIYTTYKVLKIRKSTAMAVQRDDRKVRKKYFMFMRLYLVMDAPWIIGFVAAMLPELWILKFLRMVQPILMLLAILPKKTLVKATHAIGRPFMKFYAMCCCKREPIE